MVWFCEVAVLELHERLVFVGTFVRRAQVTRRGHGLVSHDDATHQASVAKIVNQMTAQEAATA
jgi:hypothetical protein